MKKIIIAILLIATIGCKKENIEGVQNVVINYAIPSTKTLTTQTIATALNANLPASLNLKLTNTQTGEEYTIVTGKAISLPLGTYNVYCRLMGTNYTSLWSNPLIYSSDAPTLKVDETITITWDKTNYEVNANYDCFALVIDTGDASNITFKGYEAYFSTYSNAKVTFITADLPQPQEFDVTPSSGAYKKQTYNLYTSGNHSNAYKVVNGKYYILHAYEVTDLESGVITYNLPEWEEGQL